MKHKLRDDFVRWLHERSLHQRVERGVASDRRGAANNWVGEWRRWLARVDGKCHEYGAHVRRHFSIFFGAAHYLPRPPLAASATRSCKRCRKQCRDQNVNPRATDCNTGDVDDNQFTGVCTCAARHRAHCRGAVVFLWQSLAACNIAVRMHASEQEWLARTTRAWRCGRKISTHVRVWADRWARRKPLHDIVPGQQPLTVR